MTIFLSLQSSHLPLKNLQNHEPFLSKKTCNSQPMATFSTTSKSSKASKTSKPAALTREALVFPPCNYLARFDADPSHPEFNTISAFLQYSPLRYAFTAKPRMSKFLLGSFWLTCAYDAKSETISASILSDADDEPDLIFGVEDVREALRLPTYEEYDPQLVGNEHDFVVAALNYIPDPKDKSHGTLLRKNMGGVWNFLFAHVIHCLSHKTGGFDQSPSYVTHLAHALIFQRKIDFAQYFFTELATVIATPRRPQVAYHRFISMLINQRLSNMLTADVQSASPKIHFDLVAPQVGSKVLNKGPNETDHPLRPGMILFVNSPDLEWGDAEKPSFLGSVAASVSAPSVAPPIPSRVKSVAHKKTARAADTSALPKMTIQPKKPSVVSPVKTPTKRRHSSSPSKSSRKRLREPSMAKTSLLPTDSQKSVDIEIDPSRPRVSETTTATSSLASQKAKVVKSGTQPKPSSTFSLVDEDEMDSAPVLDFSSSQHGSSPGLSAADELAQPDDGSANPEVGFEDPFEFLDFLGTDTVTRTDPPVVQEPAVTEVREPSPTKDKEDVGRSSPPKIPSPPNFSPPKIPTPPKSPTPSPKKTPSKDADPNASSSTAEQPTHLFVVPEDVLENIMDTNRQHRFLGSQFEGLSNEIQRFQVGAAHRLSLLEAQQLRDVRITDSLEKESVSLNDFIKIVKDQQQAIEAISADYLKCMTSMDDHISGLGPSFSSKVDSVAKRLDDLISANTSLIVSIAALQAASLARDQELQRLKVKVDGQDDINAQILASLTKLHSKVDKLPTTFNWDIDLGAAVFSTPDRTTLQRVDRRVERVTTALRVSSPSAAEGEKSAQGEQVIKKVSDQGEQDKLHKISKGTGGPSSSPADATQGEKSLDKGKGIMTAEQEAAEARKSKELSKRSSDVDSLKLPTHPPIVDDPALIFSAEEIQAAKIAAIVHEADHDLYLKMAAEEAEKAQSTDLITAQISELEEMVRSAAQMEDLKAGHIRW